MENFQYSVQLSDQDWAEFSATAEECGLLQAGLASGDELLSSDIDQGDSSGSSPPGPQPLLRGRGRTVFEEEDEEAAQQLVSRSWHAPILAPEASQQMPGTSAQSGARPSLSFGTTSPGQTVVFQGPVASRDEMQRLLQGPPARDPAPRPPGEPPPSPESAGHGAAPQRSPGSPGALPRSPSRKKRRAAGAKGGGRSGAAGSTPTQPGSPLLPESRAEDDLGPAGSRGKGFSTGTAEQTAGAGRDQLGPESAGAPKQAARPGPGLDLSTPVPTTEQGADLLGMAPRGELHTVSSPAQEPRPGFLPSPSDVAPSATASKLHPDAPLPEPACQLRLGVGLPPQGLEVTPGADAPKPASEEAPSGVGISTPAPVSRAGPDPVQAEVAPPARPDLSPVVSSGGCQEKPREEPSTGAPEQPAAEAPAGPVQASKKKKVRFSVAVPSPEEPPHPISPATAWPSAPRTAAGGRGGPAAWDAVAVGARLPQPRILKHLPRPAPAASGGQGYRSCFAVTVPEAYEFFFCDTIVEENEDAEEEAEASEAPAQVQWPEVCEFFFQDHRPKRPGHQDHFLAQPPQTKPVPAPLPGDPMPISIPEAYEHFLREDGPGGVLGPAALHRPQATGNSTPPAGPQGAETSTPPEPGLAAAERLDLVLRRAGEPRGPLASFTFSQNDMCLVFVAFATWAVRTSDLHTPDAWKTVLLANIGTISAIRYFRWQVRRERGDPSPSPSPSPSP